MFTLDQLRQSPELREILDDNDAEKRAEGQVLGHVQGLTEAHAKAVLRLLDKRGVQLTAQQRRRISECADLQILESWLDRAIEANTAEDLFGPESENREPGC